MKNWNWGTPGRHRLVAASTRFSVRQLPTGGYVVWDRERDRRVSIWPYPSLLLAMRAAVLAGSNP